MNLKNLLFILLLPTLSFSQSKIHLDENMEEISSSRYKIKCGYHIFKCLKYTTDSLEVNKVLYKYSFGRYRKENWGCSTQRVCNARWFFN